MFFSYQDKNNACTVNCPVNQLSHLTVLLHYHVQGGHNFKFTVNLTLHSDRVEKTCCLY